MRVLIDPGSYHCANVGFAMLQVAVDRLRRLWPEAAVTVLTEDPAGLAAFCPEVSPLSNAGHQIWFADRALMGGLHRWLPRVISTPILTWIRLARAYIPQVLLALLKFRLQSREKNQLDSFLRTVDESDLIVVSGLGGLRSTERRAVDTLSLGIRKGIPTAMFSLGIAPNQPSWVCAKAARVLPFVDLIAVRERSTSLAFLHSIGVPKDRIIVTGDDAVALAYDNRGLEMGAGLGVNLRIQPSSGVGRDYIAPMRQVLQATARKLNAPLVPLPGAWDVPDVEVLQELLEGWGEHSLLSTPALPGDVIQAAGRCRVVVTGAYHIAVFALSQGIPCLCLAKSEYFLDKFRGLADQFGEGCEVIQFGDCSLLGDVLADRINRVWSEAPALRLDLLRRAAAQADLGWQAYSRLKQLVDHPVPHLTRGSDPVRSVRPRVLTTKKLT